MLKSKISGTVQEVVLPDFPDDDNTVTTTVTKSRRVSFGTNFVKEFIVGSAVSAQCMSEYEQAFPSSDSSNADSSHSAAEIGIVDHCKFVVPESLKVHKVASTIGQFVEPESVENRPKPSKFSRTICFSADSPTADMEFTEGCITLAKSILDKKNKEMTVIIQAIPKESKEEEKLKEEETKYFDASQFEMSMTKCLKSKENKREEKKFENEKTKIFSKFEDEMSITGCNKIFNDDESDGSWTNCKENLMPLDVIMHHLDKDNSDLENDLFNPKKSFSNFLNSNPFDLSNDSSEKLNLNESMDISTDFHPNVFNESLKATLPEDKLNESKLTGSDFSEKIISNESMEISGDFQPHLSKVEGSPPFFEKPTTDEAKKICTDLQPDIHEISQNSIQSNEAVDFVRIDKSNGSEKVFSNVAVEIIEDTPYVNEVTDNKLTYLKRSDEINSTVSMEICGEFSAEQKSVQLPEAVNLSSFGEEIYSIKSTDLNCSKEGSVNESRNERAGFQPDIPKDSEDVLLQSNSNNDELMKNRNSAENLLICSKDIQLNTVRASERPFTPEKICNEMAGLDELEKSTHIIIQPDVCKVFEILPPTNQIISDKPTEPSVSGKLNTSVNYDIVCQPQNDEKIVPERLNENEAMEISIAEPDASAVAESPLLVEKIANEVQPNSLTTAQHTSEDAMEITAGDQSNAFEMVENPPPIDAVTVENPPPIEAVTVENPPPIEAVTVENPPPIDAVTVENPPPIEAVTVENPPPIDAVTVENSPPIEAVTVENSDEPRMNESIKISTDNEPEVPEIRQNSTSDDQIRKSVEFYSSDETDEVPTWNREPSLVDIKMIESLKEQSKEPGCIWSLKDLRYPQAKTSGFVSFNCELLESTTTMYFHLKTSNDDRLDSCSIIKNGEINLNEEKHCRLPEYGLVIEFGFQELKKIFDERRQKVSTIRHIPYFLDQINSFLFKMNSYLRQIHSILTLYPGSRLKDSTISFRLYSFPIFFSCVVSVNLTDLFRLSTASLSFENDFGTLDENKIREIFQKCLKNENSLCEFVVQSTNYLFDIEKKSGSVSKRQHIRLLPGKLRV